MTVNNVEVTVNTCTCTDVLTITTKDQSGGIYNNYSTDGQGFMGVVNKLCHQAMHSPQTQSFIPLSIVLPIHGVVIYISLLEGYKGNYGS